MIRQIASRFVFGKSEDRSGRFVTFVGAVSIVGLALGVAALLVVTSVMNGFERELKQALSAFHGHVLLFSRAEPISNPDKIVREIERNFPEVVAISPYFFVEAMLSSSQGVAGVVIEGTDRPSIVKVTRIHEKVQRGHLPEPTSESKDSAALKLPSPDWIPEVALSSEVARKLGVDLGASVVLTIPFAGEGDSPLVRRLKVAGIVHLGMHDYDSKYALMSLPDLQRILSTGSSVNAFKIRVQDPFRSLRTTDGLNDRYVYPLRARDWSSLNRNLFYAIRLEKAVITIILFAIVFVASFNIVSTILMVVHDKRRQISMLRSLGFSRRATFALLISIGFGLALCGTVLGLGIGRILCGIVEWKSIIDLPADIYHLSRLPIEIKAWEWTSIAALSVALAAIAAMLPSFQMSRRGPAEGLRHE